MSQAKQEVVPAATVVSKVNQIRDMIQTSSLEGEDAHSDLYLEISEDGIDVFQAAPGEIILTYCSYNTDHFDSIDTEGEDVVSAIIRVEQTLDYLNMVAPEGTVQLDFSVDSDGRANVLKFTGELEGSVTLPTGDDAYDRVPDWLSDRFNDDEVYLSSPESGSKELPTRIDTTINKIDKIIEAKKNVGAKAFPIVVTDGDLKLDIGDEQGQISGSLAEDATGPDVDNTYLSGFEEVFSAVTGRITLQTAPENGPLALVQGRSNSVIRHVNTSVNVR